MTTPANLVFFHNPHSRATITHALLHELGARWEPCIIDFRKQEQLSAEYLAINPMGKVPAIRHDGVVVTENVAIFIYLADLYREAGLAPPPDEPARGTYLRWLVFYAACFEPAITDRALKRDGAARIMSPYADFATTLSTVELALQPGPWLLGERFSAADVLWGNALRWVTNFGIVDSTPRIGAYIERVTTRPAEQAARAADAALAAEMGLTD